MKKHLVAALIAGLSITAACNTNPEVAKKQYLERGNSYAEKGKYKEAMIMYRNALRKDPKYGEAYYQAALAELKMGGNTPETKAQAIRDLHRALEFQSENMDAYDKIINLYLDFYIADPRRPKIIITELKALHDKLLKVNPNSYQTVRLGGYLALADSKRKDAIAAFQQAHALKPFQPDVVLILMRALQEEGQAQAGEKLALEMLDKDPKAEGIYDALFITYLRENRGADAEALLKRKVQNLGDLPRVVVQMAAHYYAMRRPADMEAALQTMLNDPKRYPAGYKEVGGFYLRIRDLDKALRTYEAGMQRFPNEKVAYQKAMCEVLALQGRYKEANGIVEEILRANPDDDEALGIRASLRLVNQDKDNVQTAINELQTVISRMPRENSAVVRYNLGHAHQLRGNTQQARIQFEEALKIRPDYLQPRISLGDMLLKSGDNARVLQITQEVFSIDPFNVPARLLRTRALIGLGDYGQAKKELAQLSTEHPRLTEAKLQMAAIEAGTNNLKSAESIYRNVLTDGSDLRALVGLSETYFRQGRVDEAIKLLQDQVARDPKSIGTRILLGNIAMRAQRWGDAISQFKQVVDMNPREGEVWIRLGEAQRASGDLNSATASFQKAIQIVPNNAVPYLQLAMVHDASGRREQARPMYEQVLKLDPDNPVALNNVAYELAEKGGDLDQALNMAQRAKQKAPQNTDIADTLGWVYLKKNLNDPAIGIFREILRQQPNRALYRYHLGLALWQKGNKPEARKELEAALRSNPAKDEEQKIRELMAKLG